jgi:hypothetical protein
MKRHVVLQEFTAVWKKPFVSTVWIEESIFSLKDGGS